MTNGKSLLWLSDLMLLGVAIVWGTSYGVVKSALFFYPVLGLLTLRFGITFLILSPALRNLSGLSLMRILGLSSTGVLLLAIFLSETYGLMYTTATNAAFLISLCVMLTPLVEWLWLKRKPSAVEWCAVGLSLLGAVLMTQNGSWTLNMGDGLILLAALFRAVQVCLIKRVTQNCQVPALAVTALQSGIVALGCATLTFMVVPDPIGQLVAMSTPGAFWGYLIYLVLACTLFAFFAQNYAIKRSTPTRVSLLMGSEPVFGGIFAMLWLDEMISLQGWIGGMLIFTACLLASIRWTPSRIQVPSPAA